jgi:hypothetical protein
MEGRVFFFASIRHAASRERAGAPILSRTSGEGCSSNLGLLMLPLLSSISVAKQGDLFVRRSIFLIVAASALGLSGCGGAANTNVANSNQPVANANANKDLANKTPDASSGSVDTATQIGSLATPEDAYRTAYALREKKDAAGLKRTLSKDVIEVLTLMGEDEKKSLDEEIATMFEKPQAKTNEFRNVKISGDRASLQYPDDKGAWKTMEFVKENGEWKMAFPPKEDIQIESGVQEKKGNN